jgi:hypothetical protein
MKTTTRGESPLSATPCSALIEEDYYVSPCGKFHGCREDYTEEEWEEIVTGDNVIVSCGTTVESAIAQLMDAGLSAAEIAELIPLPNAQADSREE